MAAIAIRVTSIVRLKCVFYNYNSIIKLCQWCYLAIFKDLTVILAALRFHRFLPIGMLVWYHQLVGRQGTVDYEGW